MAIVHRLSTGAGQTPRVFAGGVCAALLLALVSSARADEVRQGTSSAEARRDAIRSIPYAKLTRDARAKVSKVLASPTIYRRLPTQVIDCDPTFYLFLVEHPDLVVNIWDVLQISEMKLQRLGPDTFQADDGAGTRGEVEYLYRGHDTHVIYADGTYEGPLFARPLAGRCLMILRTAYVRETDGRYYVTCRLDAFLQLDNIGVEVLAKTFKPLVGAAADHNFRETAAFVSTLNRAAEINQGGFKNMTARLSKVQAEHRDQLAALGEQLALQEANRQSAPVRPEPSPAPAAKTARRPGESSRTK